MNAPRPPQTPHSLEVTLGGYSTEGRKQDNEDAFAALQPEGSARVLKGVVAAIADGVSTSNDPQKASQTAVTQFVEDYLATPDTWTVKTSAARVLDALNRWLFHHSQHEPSLITTFTGLVVKARTAHVFHAGDSRTYLWRDGDLQQLTRDHRSGQRAFLTRALGLDTQLEVDYLNLEIEQNDVLVLTTDGVHDHLTDTCLLEVLHHQGNLESLAECVVKTALANGSTDNATCLMLRVENIPVEDIDDLHERLTAQAIPPALDVGTVLDGYRILKVIHAGTRSHLYLAEDPQERSAQVVIKVPSENFADDPVYLDGFVREAWIGQRLDHPNIVRVLQRPEQSRFLYCVYEYLDGKTLRQWMLDNHHPPLERVREIVEEIATALRAMQRKQMTHRDLKPENVMIDHHGRIKLIDFGTVHVRGFDDVHGLLTSEVPAGSVGYVAPECLMGHPATHLSDLYALGVITYELLTGELPFRTTLNRQPQHKPAEYRTLTNKRDDIPEWVDLTIRKATVANPTRRYPALSEFLSDLRKPNPEMLQQIDAKPFIERHPTRFWQLVSLLLLIGLVMSLST